MPLARKVVGDDVAPAVSVGDVDDEHPVEPSRPDEGLVQHLGAVGRTDHEDERLVRGRTTDDAEPAQDLEAPAILDQLTERIHLVEERVEAHAAAAHEAADGHAAGLRRAVLPDRVELVHEQDAGATPSGLGVLARETARVAEQLHDHQLGHADEHALERARIDVDEGQVGLLRDARGEERLAGPGRAGQQHALGHLAAAQLELLDAAQDADRGLGMFQQVRLAAVVLEREPDLRVVRSDGVLARPGQEPEQDAELEDDVRGRERELQRERRGGADQPEDPLDELRPCRWPRSSP